MILDAHLTKVAIGLNLADKNTSNWSYYKGKPFRSMLNFKSDVAYGKRVIMSQYRIKAYDKTYEQKVHHNYEIPNQITRIEKEVNNLYHYKNRSRPINLRHPKQLMDKSLLMSLFDDFILNISCIETKVDFGYSCLPLTSLKNIAAMQNEMIRLEIKNNHKESYKKIRAKYNKLISEWTNNDIPELCKALKTKALQLLNT